MSDSRARTYIQQMQRAATDACAFVEGFDKNGFMADRRTQQAVVMSLMIIGEAAVRIIDRDPDYVARHSRVPWTSMRGLRNRIAHGYFEIDMEIVWTTVHVALPDLLAELDGLPKSCAAQFISRSIIGWVIRQIPLSVRRKRAASCSGSSPTTRPSGMQTPRSMMTRRSRAPRPISA